MEPKRLLLTIGVCILFVVVWTWGTAKFAEWQGWDLNKRAESTQNDTDAEVPGPGLGDDLPAPGIGETPAVTPDDPTPDAPATQGSTDPGENLATDGQIVVAEQGTPQILTLGSTDTEDPTFSLGIDVNTRGAGVDQIVLNSYAQSTRSDDRYTFQQPYTISPDTTRPLSTRSVQLLGKTVRLDDVVWKVDQANTDHRQALLYVDLADANGPLVRVKKFIKVFEVDEQIGDNKYEHGGYEIRVTQSLKNLRSSSLQARMTLVGPNGPPSDLEQGYDRYVVLGRTGKNGVEYDPISVDNFDEDDPTDTFTFRDSDDGDLVWAGQGSIYFNAILRPTTGTTPKLAQVVGEAVDPKSTFREVTTRFVTETLELEGGQETNITFAGYFGPKSDLLENDHYSQASIGYDRTLVSPFGCTWCVFEPVVDILKWLLNIFYFLLRDWGMAIIG
ncbi:MAG: YidC/Oxa1 family insertase periplasmic-domain containing protein, partial [Planctomycetota bacterium]